ncbi:MAG: FtsB family cell division protein [Armatimonadota bacterium]
MRKRGRRSKFARAFRTISTPVALAVLVGFLSYPFLRQWRIGAALDRKVVEARAHLDRLIQENGAVEREVNFLQTDEGAETMARKKGYRRAGEKVYRIRAIDGGTPTPAR